MSTNEIGCLFLKGEAAHKADDGLDGGIALYFFSISLCTLVLCGVVSLP